VTGRAIAELAWGVYDRALLSVPMCETFAAEREMARTVKDELRLIAKALADVPDEERATAGKDYQRAAEMTRAVFHFVPERFSANDKAAWEAWRANQ